jgi:gas vesicle protein
MFRLLNKKRGQNTAEYAILIGVIVAAAIAMQIYVRRGMQARIRDAVDYSKNLQDESGTNVFNTSQYEPYYMDSDLTTASDSESSESMAAGGQITRDITNQYSERTGEIRYGNWSGN